MPRPCSRRRICGRPISNYFKPQGLPLRELEENSLSIDEFEAVRLVDYLEMSQEESCLKMEISQPTLSRILKSARNKIAKTIVKGEALRIESNYNKT